LPRSGRSGASRWRVGRTAESGGACWLVSPSLCGGLRYSEQRASYSLRVDVPGTYGNRALLAVVPQREHGGAALAARSVDPVYSLLLAGRILDAADMANQRYLFRVERRARGALRLPRRHSRLAVVRERW